MKQYCEQRKMFDIGGIIGTNAAEFGLSHLKTALSWQVITQGTVESAVKFIVFSHISLF